MKCPNCGKETAGSSFCMNCGKPIPQKKTKKEKKKLRTSVKALIIGGSILTGLVAVAAAALFFVLPKYFDLDILAPMPEYTVDYTSLEAGVDYDVSNRVQIAEEDSEKWKVQYKKDDIDTSQLGVYTAVYLLKSERKDYEIEVEFEVVEGEIPTIIQSESEFEYGGGTDLYDFFELKNAKDFLYEVDDSQCDFNKIGTYTVYVRLWNEREFDEIYDYEVTVVDTQKPELSVPSSITILEGEAIIIENLISANDDYDGDLSSDIEITSPNLSEPGEYYYVFSVTDSSGNVDMKQTKVLVYDVAEMGEEFEISNWTVTVKKIYYDNRIDDRGLRGYIYFYYDAPDGYTFLVVNLTVTNNSAETDCFADALFSYPDETLEIECEGFLTYDNYHVELANDLTDSDTNLIKAGKTKSGKIYFLVPDELKESDESIILKISDADKSGTDGAVYIYLR